MKPAPTRGREGWREEAFRLWGLTLVALCSPGEVLVSTTRIGTLPVSSSVLDVSSSGGVPSGTPGSSWRKASSISSTASHATHGSPRTSWASWTSAEWWWHPSALTGWHTPPHTVHWRLLPSKRDFKFAPLKIFPVKPFHGSLGRRWVFIGHCGIAFGLSCFLVQVDVDHGLPSSLVHLNNPTLLKEVCQII